MLIYTKQCYLKRKNFTSFLNIRNSHHLSFRLSNSSSNPLGEKRTIFFKHIFLYNNKIIFLNFFSWSNIFNSYNKCVQFMADFLVFWNNFFLPCCRFEVFNVVFRIVRSKAVIQITNLLFLHQNIQQFKHISFLCSRFRELGLWDSVYDRLKIES